MISLEDFIERLCRLGADRGPRRFPRKQRDRDILMKSIVMLMDSARHYTEPEINELLMEWKRSVAPCIETDYVTVRRLLVDYGKLERTPDGSHYRVGFPLGDPLFDLEVDDIDLRATVAAYIDYQRRKKRPPPNTG
jgi:hypothetical protein